jgi:ubiquinone/menaquinone biosynthesis C-methylase UbiE
MSASIQNPNDVNAQYYDDIYAYIKGSQITDQECLLIISLLGKEQGNVLDIGAGTGRHAITLAERGYQVTALDSSSEMLNRLHAKSKAIKTIQANIFELATQSNFKYDLIIMMWNAFNEIALTNVSAKKLLSKCQQLLNTNGKILINIDDPQPQPFIPQFRSQQHLNGDKILLEWNNLTYNPKTHITLSEEKITINGKQKPIAQIRQRWWTVVEIEKLAKQLNLDMVIHKIKGNTELYIALSL